MDKIQTLFLVWIDGALCGVYDNEEQADELKNKLERRRGYIQNVYITLTLLNDRY